MRMFDRINSILIKLLPSLLLAFLLANVILLDAISRKITALQDAPPELYCEGSPARCRVTVDNVQELAAELAYVLR